MRSLAWLLGVHCLLYLGLGRQYGVWERLSDYPAHFVRMWSTGALGDLLEPSLLTLLYLCLSIVATWVLMLALRRTDPRVLQFLSSLPAFITVLFAVFITFQIGRNLDLGVWLDQLHPWVLVVFTLALALPVASRAALLMQGRTAEFVAARFSDAARAQGMTESRVRARAWRVALPEAAGLLAAEALGLAASLMLLEGVLQFPGLGKAAFSAFEAASGGVGGYTDSEIHEAIARSSAPLLLLLLLAGAYQGIALWVVSRLDPRRRA